MVKDRKIETSRQETSDNRDRFSGNTPRESAVPDKKVLTKNWAAWRTISILGFLLVFAFSYILWPLWSPSVPSGMHTVISPVMEVGRTAAITGRVESLSQKLLGIEKDLKNAKETLAKTSEMASAASAKTDIKKIDKNQRALSIKIEVLAAKLDVFSKKIEDLKRTPASAETSEAINALATNSNGKMIALERENLALRALIKNLGVRVGTLESQPVDSYGIGKRDALLLAVGRLRDVTRTANEFSTSFAAAQALSINNPENKVSLEILQKYAAKGVPSLTVLQRRFDSLSGDIVRASYVAAGDGWVDQTILKLSKLITFRRTGVEGALKDDIAGLVARVELLLLDGDLKAAVGIVRKFIGEPARVSYKWLKAAQGRLAIDAAVEKLFQNALHGAQGNVGSGR